MFVQLLMKLFRFSVNLRRKKACRSCISIDWKCNPSVGRRSWLFWRHSRCGVVNERPSWFGLFQLCVLPISIFVLSLRFIHKVLICLSSTSERRSKMLFLMKLYKVVLFFQKKCYSHFLRKVNSVGVWGENHLLSILRDWNKKRKKVIEFVVVF